MMSANSGIVITPLEGQLKSTLADVFMTCPTARIVAGFPRTGGRLRCGIGTERMKRRM